MKKKLKKGVSEPLGLVLVILISVTLMLLVFFWAWVYTTDVMHHQGAQIVVAGTPYAHYFPSNNTLKEIVVVLHNPTHKPIELRGLIIKGTYIDVGVVVPPKKNYRVDIDLTPYNLVLTDTEVNSGYMEFVVVTDLGTLTAYAQLHPYG